MTPLGSLSCVREGTGLGATCVLGGTAAAYSECQDGNERLDQLTAPTYHLRSQWAPTDYLLVFPKATDYVSDPGRQPCLQREGCILRVCAPFIPAPT